MTAARGRHSKGVESRVEGFKKHEQGSDILYEIQGVGVKTAEGRIQDLVGGWLRSLGIEYRPQYRTSKGPVDLHLLNRRIIIEVKSESRLHGDPYRRGTGSLNVESAYDQLSRYVDEQRNQTRLSSDQNRWHGVVTNGKRWWVWKWPLPGAEGEPEIVMDWNGKPLNSDTANDLMRILLGQKSEKMVVPDEPKTLFVHHRKQFAELYEKERAKPDTVVQKLLWLEQLKASGIHPDKANEDELFVVHTMLILISRLISGSSTPTGVNRIDDLFYGFVGWVASDHEEVLSLQRTIKSYEWHAMQGDIMRSLYMGFVPAEQRKSYGEYYTPDWLAEIACAEVIDNGYIEQQLDNFVHNRPIRAILDPACGSGTFVYHAARLVLNSPPVQQSSLTRREKSDFVCQMVYGIDIHPVAVEMSMANMHRAIPDIAGSKLNIYQGDSLLAKNPVNSIHSVGNDNVSIYTPRNTTLILPIEFLRDPQEIEKFVMSARDGKPLPDDIGGRASEHDKGLLVAAHAVMANVINEEGNGVWAWYIRNQSIPVLLSTEKRIARIVSNPPWVRNSDITDPERSRVLKDLGEKMGVYVGGKMATNYNMAAIFVGRCSDMYIDKDSKSKEAWVLPRAAMQGPAQWERLRKSFGSRIGFWDLGRFAFPKQDISCVLFAGRKQRNRMLVKTGKHLPRHGDAWSGNVEFMLRLDTISKASFTAKISEWVKGKSSKPVARNGATIFPAPLVRIKNGAEPVKGKYAAFTTVAARQRKWRLLKSQTGTVPAEWVWPCIMGHDILPFCIPSYTKCIIPMTSDGKWIDEKDANKYWRNAAATYRQHCGKGASTPKTLEDCLDYNAKLTSQFKSGGDDQIVYNSSGNRLCAALPVPKNKNMINIVEHSAYRVPCASRSEAYFLIAVLNSDAVHAALRWSKESSRHFDTKFWKKVPIPRYDSSNKHHLELKRHGYEAEKKSTAAYDGTRGWKAREHILAELRKDGVLEKIDMCVQKILPRHAKKHSPEK